MPTKPCPRCHSTMAVLTEIDGDTWICPCGYQEDIPDEENTDYEDWCQRE